MRFPASPTLLEGETVAFSWNSVVQHSPKDMPLQAAGGGNGGESVLAAAFGAVWLNHKSKY